MVESLLDKYSVFILDFDGTLFNGHKEIPGVAKTVHRLFSAGKTCLFFTNGGYCTVEYNYNQLIKWLEHELTP